MLVVVAFGWMVKRVPARLPQYVGLLPVYAIGTVAMYWLMERVASMLIPAANLLLRLS